ncbi:MAG: hypothetical protein AAF703_03355 [Cyanobacteria bacterium P01_D01_bin.105]
MSSATYRAPWPLTNGFLMTLYVGLWAAQHWERTVVELEPAAFEEKIFIGAQGVPLYALVAIPPKAKGTVIGPYGITGDLDDQWFLRIIARKAYAKGYAVVLFMTQQGGYVGYISSVNCQQQFQDCDRWWAWNRVFDWFDQP